MYFRARNRRALAAVIGCIIAVAASTVGAVSSSAADLVPTTTTMELNPDGTGTVRVTADGATPTSVVDFWIDSTWQRALTLEDGEATIDVGPQPPGDYRITVRYRGDDSTAASQVSRMWTAPGTVQVPTTTTLDLNPDGTGTVRVTADGATPTNHVDLWIDTTWQRAYALKDGQATIDLGERPGGDYRITVRYRPNGTTAASQASIIWTSTTADQVPTTTRVSVLPDGTGTLRVAASGEPATNLVDMWVGGKYKRAYELTNGQTTFDLGTRAGGDIPIHVRYRPSASQQASTAVAMWSVDTSPKPEPGDCGETITKDDGEAWTCTFADDFDGTTLNGDRWRVQTHHTTGDGPKACYFDSKDNVAVQEGALHLTLRKGEPTPCPALGGELTSYTAGMVTTFHKWSQQYGRIEARIKTTGTTHTGLQEAFWMWPDVRYPEGQGKWPANGEIDIMETYSSYPHLAVPFLHTDQDVLGSILSGPSANTNWTCAAERGVYNTYTLEWSAERVEIFVNGESCLVNTSGNEAFKKRYILALTQGPGARGNLLTPDTPVPATMSVDYVRAWS